jgi:PIN domain nuclease of toxin-antitoxin system
MKYLLDTATFLWAVSNPEKLSEEVTNILEDTQNIIFVSAVTFWEISIKVAKGGLRSGGILPQQLPDVAIQSGFKIIPLSVVEGATYHELEAQWNEDPFNGMLRWQATQQNLVLISNGNTIKKYNSLGLKVVW